jgi:hypothetical protein
MAIPVKISDSLLEAARSTADGANRSLTKQIEHWAELGRAVEALLPLPDLVALKGPMQHPGDAQKNAAARAALARLTAALTKDHDRAPALAIIRSTGKPVYEAAAKGTEGVVQVWPDGSRVTGRFVGGRFVAFRSGLARKAG